jgi:hypothetical protein
MAGQFQPFALKQDPDAIKAAQDEAFRMVRPSLCPDGGIAIRVCPLRTWLFDWFAPIARLTSPSTLWKLLAMATSFVAIAVSFFH